MMRKRANMPLMFQWKRFFLLTALLWTVSLLMVTITFDWQYLRHCHLVDGFTAVPRTTSRRRTTSGIALTSLLRQSSASATPDTVTFRSCPPPRFDVFGEALVGNWQTTSTAGKQPTTTTTSVQEVMRSCGGAVQGIRESMANDHQYLNRADDGFLHRDDGNYSWGPTKMKPNNDDSSDALSGRFLTSLPVSDNDTTTTQRRILFDATAASTTTPILLQKPRYGGDESPKAWSVREFSTNGNEKDNRKISWTRHVRCRMPSPSMPWMVQRLVWESCHQMEPSLIGDKQAWPVDENDPAPSAMLKDKGIVVIQYHTCPVENLQSPLQMEQKWQIPPSCWLYNKNNDHGGPSQIYWNAVASQGTMFAVGREYDPVKHCLVSLVWSEGEYSMDAV